jgi:uncharacterized protein
MRGKHHIFFIYRIKLLAIFTHLIFILAAKGLEDDLEIIALQATTAVASNEAFRLFLNNKNPYEIDALVLVLNKKVAAAIDCTKCGNCCRAFMINVSQTEAEQVAAHLKISPLNFKENYLEESQQGKLIMKSMPCTFLQDNKCTVYKSRFSGCRDFPHLDRPNFTGRLFGTFMYYGTCPIIFNVVEQLKIATNFRL